MHVLQAACGELERHRLRGLDEQPVLHVEDPHQAMLDELELLGTQRRRRWSRLHSNKVRVFT